MTEKSRQGQYKDEYDEVLESEMGEWTEASDVMQMKTQVVLDSAREVCGSVRLGRKNPKSEWQNDGG